VSDLRQIPSHYGISQTKSAKGFGEGFELAEGSGSHFHNFTIIRVVKPTNHTLIFKFITVYTLKR